MTNNRRVAVDLAQTDPSTPAELCAVAVPAADPTNREYTEPEQVLEAGVDYRAIFCTDAGPVYLDLFETYAPVTVNSFVFLAQNDYYNNTIFHRVIQDFMVQGGDPTATGSGGPGYQFKDEFVGFLNFDRPGWLAMANANNPEQGIVGTNGSQFFITTVPTTHLDYRHTIFGEVLEGQENVDNVVIRDPGQPDSPSTKLETVLIITDPALVETTYTAPVSAEPAEILTALDGFKAQLPADIVMTNPTELSTLETEVATAPEEVSADYQGFLEKYNYQSGATSTIDNTSCNLDSYAFVNLSYTLSAFGSADDAFAALSDGFLETLAAAEGFTKTETSLLGANLYTRPVELCNTTATQGRIYVQRGHYIATIEAAIPADRPYGVDAVMDQFAARIYELTLADILRREVRRQ
ncbi:MAG: peptidylprolyl isomerase [Anaerolineae bacterium]|nr:peptidylprolyl isomerase [Anaerolineae bacterium]